METLTKSKTYAEIYEEATQKILQKARRIGDVAQTKIHLKYKLPDIVYTLRELYKDPLFRNKFMGAGFSSIPKWSRGMCARGSHCIYQLYGGEKVWDFYNISLKDWPVSSVTFLRDKFQNIEMGTTGEHFAPLTIPYDIGLKLSVPPARQYETDEFIDIVKSKLERL